MILAIRTTAQVAVCGTPGIDGPANAAAVINSYFAINGNQSVPAGSTSLVLGAVPATDASGNTYGSIAIAPGDLVLIIQMQDADITTANSDLYGGNSATGGPDGLGGTGYTALNSTGRYEYLVATNSVALTGGTLTFRAGGTGGGTVFGFVNQDGTATVSQKRFQVVRVPQYSNLTLTSDLICPPWNGSAGGVLAFDVAGSFNFGGFTVNANARGFRGGYQDQAASGANVSTTYVTTSLTESSGKGENIAGTPRYMWNGFNPVDLGATWNGFPGGDFGRGAPGNGGGGGNDHNAGGGGGGNGGAGGVGGLGWQGAGGTNPSGGRPGVGIPQALGRLYLGGGGGGGDANNATTGVRGGVGGGLVIMNVGNIVGAGTITANGSDGEPGVFGTAPDGAGGGGGAGTIFVNASQPSPTANLTLQANGGRGGNTLNDNGFEHGPGGGGGGGVIWYNLPGATISAVVTGGASGRANNGAGIVHGSADGQGGSSNVFASASLPTYLQGTSASCLPTMSVTKTSASATSGLSVPQGANTTYTLVASNATAGGGAAAVQVRDLLPSGFSFVSATATYANGASGPATLTNQGTAQEPVLGDFALPAGGTVTIELTVSVNAAQAPGVYHNGAEISYPDPTRTSASPDRRISPATNAYAGSNTTYQTGGSVPGSNYSNAVGGPAGENVFVLAIPRPGNDAFTMNEDAVLSDVLSTNDSDADDPLSSLIWSLLDGGTAAANGTVVVNANGTFTYTPNPNVNGTFVFEYNLCDDDGLCGVGTVSITVNALPDAPVANDDNGGTLTEDGPNGFVNILTNDTDADGNPSGPTNGVGQFTVDLDLTTAGLQTTITTAQGTWIYNPANGAIDLALAANVNGPVTLPYRLCDPTGLCDDATITFTVTAVNDVPIANNDNGGTLQEDGPNGTINVLLNDTDADGNPTAPTNNFGQFSVDLDPDAVGLQIIFTTTQGVWTYSGATGVVTFDPATDFNGTATLTYVLCDPAFGCDDAVITFTVDPVNDPPVANNDAVTIAEDGQATLSVVTNDNDIADGGALDLTSLTVIDGPNSGTAVANTDGTITYTPGLNFTGNDTVTYRICDLGTPLPALCSTAILVITVTPVNDGPVANDDTGASLTEDGPNGTVSILTNDTDVDGNPAAPTNGPGQFTVDLNAGTAGIQTTVTNAQGVWTYNATTGVVTFDPADNFNGTATLTYVLCDAAGLCDNAVITFGVTAVNDAPVANDDNGGSIIEDGANGIVDILTNDTDVEGNPTAPTNGPGQFTVDMDLATAGVQATITTAQGVWTYNPAIGLVVFDPANNFTGSATTSYRLCDAAGLCDDALITFTVTAVNDAPVANDDNGGNLVEDGANGTVSVLLNDTDAEGNPSAPTNNAGQFSVDLDPATVGLQTSFTNAQGVWTYSGVTGVVTFDPATHFTGTATLTYQLCDPGPLCDNAVITFVVGPVNDPPVANDDAVTIAEGAVATLNVLTNDNDLIDGGGLDLSSLTVIDGPNSGTAVANTDGTITYTPGPDFNGNDTVTYRICDLGTPLPALCSTALFVITVTPVNDPPVATDDNGGTLTEDGPNGTVSILPNDTDAEGNPTAPTNGVGQFTVDLAPGAPGVQTSFTSPQGVWTYDVATGVVTFDPALNFTGTATTIYTLCDPQGLCDNAVITFVVSPVNDAPVATDDNGGSILEDGPNGTINVLLNDTDPDGNPTAPTNGAGQFTVDLDVNTPGLQTTVTTAQGVWSYDAVTGIVSFDGVDHFNGTVTLTYQLCDADGLCDPAAITFIVAPVNDPPVANDDVDNMLPNTTLITNVWANDNDLLDQSPVDAASITIIGGPDNGTAVANPDGTISYTPTANYVGNDTITYRICDLGVPAPPLCDTAILVITVTNAFPLAVDDNVLLNEDAFVVITVLQNDDAVSGVLVPSSVQVTVAPVNGTAVANADGTVTYTPGPNFNGTDVFNYTVCNDQGFCSIATVLIAVNAVNDAPVVNDDAATTDEDTPVTIAVLANDNDAVDNSGMDPTSVNVIDGPANGTTSVNPDGTVTYTPGTDFTGTDTFTYVSCDLGVPLPALCDTAVVVINVQSLVDAPVAVNDDGGDLTEDGADGTVNILTNDTDVDGNPSAPTNGAGQFSVDLDLGTTGLQTSFTNAQGEWTYDAATGVVTFNPADNVNGVISISYQLCDPTALCDNAAISFNVLPVNDVPLANDDAASTEEDTDVTIDVLGNDNDDTDNSGLDAGSVNVIDGPNNGTATVNGDGSITYTPAVNYAGNDTLTYVVCDLGVPLPALCDTAIVVITVDPLNDAPIITDGNGIPVDSATAATPEDQAIILCLSVTDADGDVVDVTGVLNGPAFGTISGLNDNDTCFTYTPDVNFFGTDSVLVVVCDVNGACDTVYVGITVTPVNDAPLAVDDAASTDEDTDVTIDVLGNDNDDADNSGLDVGSVSVIDGPSNGTATVNGDGSITYTPDPNFNGADTLTYVVCDLGVPLPALCDTAIVVITVIPVNDAPFITPTDTIFTSTGVDTPLTLCVNVSDADGDDLDITSVLLAPLNGALSGLADGDTCFTYTPDPGYTGGDTLTISICDPFGLCDTVVVVIDVIPNLPPVIVDDGGTPIDSIVISTPEEEAITVCLNAIDPDGDAVDVTGFLNGPAFGTISGLNDNDTCFTYTPDVNFFGTDSVLVVVCDVNGGCDTLYVGITVTPLNDAPLAVDDAVSTDEDTAITIDVLGNDNDDADNSGLDVGSVSVIDGPSNGTATVNGDGSITYTPDPNFNGNDTLTYVVCDLGVPLPALCDTAIVVITVDPVNDAPIITDGNNNPTDTLFTSTGVDLPLTVCVNVTDADGDDLDITSVLLAPLNGTLSGLADGDTCFTYTPDPGYTGGDTLTISICDPFGLCDTVVVVIDVIPNLPPVIVDEGGTPIDSIAITTPEEEAITVCLNAIDPDGDAVDVTGFLNGPAFGTISGLNDNDTCFTYTPDVNFFGTDSVLVVVCDVNGGCDTLYVGITVTPLNDAPLAVDDAASTDEDTAITIDVLGNDNDDADNSGLDAGSVSVIDGPSNGTATVNGDGSITYTPDPNFNGTDTLTYVVCDLGVPLPALCDTAIVVITVNPVNDAPIITDGNNNPTDTLFTSTDVNVPLLVCVNVSDVDGDDLDITSVLLAPLNGTLSGLADGDTCFTYTPDPGYTGGDTLTISICDPFGLCDTVVVVINVIPDLPPIAVDDTASVVTGNTVDIDVQGNDSDPEGGPLTTTSATADNGTVVINGNGTITYTPNEGFCGTDTITYTVCDDAGFCDSAIVLVQVLCPPVAVDDAVSTNEDTSVVIDPLDNDTDGNGDVLDITSATAGNGTVTINDDGTITYVPNPNYCGTDTITYTVCDGSGLCDTGIIVVTVVCVNDPPIAVDDVANTGEGDPVPVDVTDNDTDVDGDILTVTNATAGNGTVVINGNGTITYTPNQGFCGTDTITYTVCDPGPLCDQAIVVVTVACDPDEVLIPQGFSPNGDGIGDTWVIAGLELYPQASVQIFNRYGNVVYEATPYANDWDGTNTNGLSVGDQLPIGTYWYILDPGTGDEPWSGYVYLNR